jgi:hypothetical protein
MTRKAAALFSLLLAAAFFFARTGSTEATSENASPPNPRAAAQDTSGWKRYGNAEYGFEMAYPAEWEFDANYEDNYGKQPSGNRPSAYAGETRSLFNLEMDGPDQSHQGGGYFEDGAIITVRITGTAGTVEDWNVTPTRPWFIRRTTPSSWLRLHTPPIGGDDVQKAAIDANGFTGAVEVACNGSSPCKLFEEEGGAYRTVAGGRVLLISWERAGGGNDFSYQKYFLPMLSSVKLFN